MEVVEETYRRISEVNTMPSELRGDVVFDGVPVSIFLLRMQSLSVVSGVSRFTLPPNNIIICRETQKNCAFFSDCVQFQTLNISCDYFKLVCSSHMCIITMGVGEKSTVHNATINDLICMCLLVVDKFSVVISTLHIGKWMVNQRVLLRMAIREAS